MMGTRTQAAHGFSHSARIRHRLESRFEITLGLNRLRKQTAEGGIAGSRREGEPGRTNQERREELPHFLGGVGLWEEQLEWRLHVDGKGQTREYQIKKNRARLATLKPGVA